MKNMNEDDLLKEWEEKVGDTSEVLMGEVNRKTDEALIKYMNEDIKFLGDYRGIKMYGNDACAEAIQYFENQWKIESKKNFEMEIANIKPPTFWQTFWRTTKDLGELLKIYENKKR